MNLWFYGKNPILMKFSKTYLYTDNAISQMTAIERDGLLLLSEETVSYLEGKILQIRNRRVTVTEIENLESQIQKFDL
jgi:hypothetical protein